MKFVCSECEYYNEGLIISKCQRCGAPHGKKILNFSVEKERQPPAPVRETQPPKEERDWEADHVAMLENQVFLARQFDHIIFLLERAVGTPEEPKKEDDDDVDMLRVMSDEKKRGRPKKK